MVAITGPQFRIGMSEVREDVRSTFEAVYRGHRAFVKNALRTLYVDPADLEDVTQEVFVVLYRRMLEGESPATMRSWLFHVARRTAANQRRGRRRHERKLALPWRDTEQLDPEDSVARAEATEFVADFLAELDADACQAFVLAEVRGLRGAEVARELGIAVPTAYARVRAVRRRFERTVRRRRATSLGRWFAFLPFVGRGPSTAGVAVRTRWLFGVAAACVAVAAVLVLWLRSGPAPDPPSATPVADSPRPDDKPRSRIAEGVALPSSGPPEAGTAAFSGRVVDGHGDPIPSATVCGDRTEVPDHTLTDPPRCTVTDAQGRFRVDGFLAEAHTLEAMAESFVPGRVHTLPGEGLVITLVGGGVPISGRVVDVYGGPVAGAWVARKILSEPTLGSTVLTDDDGRFELWSRAGRGVLAVGGDGYSTVHEATVAPAAQLEIALTPESSVSGQVVDRSTGEPVAGARVAAVLLPGPARYRLTQASTFADDEGRFELRGLHPARYILDASAGERWGHPPRPFDMGIGEHIDAITIEMVSGATIAGIITDADTGAPCPEGFATTLDEVQSISREGRVDAQGRVRIDGLVVADEYEVVAACRGYQSQTYVVAMSEGPPQMNAWPLQRGQHVTGTVVDPGGVPVPNADVRLTQARARSLFDRAADFVTTGPKGVFVFDGVAAGEYRLFVNAPGYPNVPGDPLQVVQGKDVQVELQLELGGRVTGVLRGTRGEPLGGALVSVQIEKPNINSIFGPTPAQVRAMEAGGPFAALTDVRGEFSVTGVREGAYGIWVTPGPDAVVFRHPLDHRPQQEPSLTTVDVTAAADTRVELAIETGDARLRGQVTDETGDVVVDAAVFVRAAGRAREITPYETGATRTDAEGRFEIEGLVDSQTYDVVAFRKGGGQVELVGASPGSDAELVFATPGRVSGVVRDADGTPPVGFKVMVVHTDGTRRWLPLAGTLGQFEVGALKAGTWTITVGTPAGKASRVVELATGQHAGGIELVLSDETILSGRLVDSAGAELAGYTVAVVDAGVTRTPGTVRSHTATDLQGRFRLGGLSGSEGDLELIAGTESTPEAFEAAAVLRIVQARSGETADLGDVSFIAEAPR